MIDWDWTQGFENKLVLVLLEEALSSGASASAAAAGAEAEFGLGRHGAALPG